MNPALTSLSERIDIWADIASAAIWRACWQGAIAVALVWVVCLAWRRLSPRWQCWLWRLAVVKFALALVWAAPFELPLLTPPPPVEVVTTAEPITFAPMVMPAIEQPLPILETIEVTASPAPVPAWRPRGVVIAMALWCTGVAVCTVRLRRQWWLARRLRVGAGLVGDVELIRILDEERTRAGLRRSPLLLVTDSPTGPALVGIVSPAIVLPAAMLATLSPDSLRLLLRHELSHQQRRDLAWNLLLAVVGAVFFFHPLIWLALRRHRQTQESACDARVLDSGDAEPASYGQLLVDVAAGFAAGGANRTNWANPAVTGVVSSARTLKQRLSAMPHFRPPTARTTVVTVLVLCVTATVGLVPWRLVAREPVDIVAEILANWEERRRDVTSFEYELRIEGESVITDVHGRVIPSSRTERQAIRSTVTFARSGNKSAMTESGENQLIGSDVKNEHQRMYVFDGTVSKSISNQGHGLTCRFEKTAKPDSHLASSEHAFAIILEQSPREALNHLEFDVEKAKLVHQHTVHNGHDCAEIVIPAAHGVDMLVRIFVDRARDDVPVGIVIEFDGAKTIEYSLTHERDDRVGWTIAAWSVALYNHKETAAEVTIKVTRRTFNEPIADDVFDLTFPPGARVLETDGNRINHYDAQEDGTLRLIKEEQWEPTATFELSVPSDDNKDAEPTTKWTTLRGRFVYQGEPPQPKPIKVTKDIKLLANKNLVDESLLVGEDGGIANVVVMYVPPKVEGEDGRTHEVLDIHPDLAESVADRVSLVAEAGQLRPRITAVWLQEQELWFFNRDSVSHNINLTPVGDRPVNTLIRGGGDKVLRMSRQQSQPVPVTGSIHSWLRAYVLPRNNPYVAVTAADGTFEIKDLPAGVQRFRVWHERSGWLDVGRLERGFLSVELTDETTQLPTFRIPGDIFETRVTGTFEPSAPEEDSEIAEPAATSDEP